MALAGYTVSLLTFTFTYEAESIKLLDLQTLKAIGRRGEGDISWSFQILRLGQGSIPSRMSDIPERIYKLDDHEQADKELI
ncbi:hypothetical protein J6590_055252 [Homalodisca vitripennis]|nr:hypothetical protein J6590_055252 [Homalodisca vitripennis]